MTTTPKYIIGSISHGTMREEDLIPAFMWALEQLDAERAKAIRADNQDVFERLEAGEQADPDGCFLNETLFDALNELAPPYFYFGSHSGDGADYGFWLSEGAIEEFDGLRVSDTSEVPADYAGEVLHVNDHGNVTLYAKDEGSSELREVWAIV